MFALLKTREGVCLLGGWFFLWLMLEMVFFGEPLFHYETRTVGYDAYFVMLATTAAVSLVVARLGDKIVQTFVRHPLICGVCGLIGSVSLVAICGSSFAGALMLGAILYGAVTPLLLAVWFFFSISMVYRHGLREVLSIVLLGVILSFVLMPRFLRSDLYGMFLTALSPLSLGMLWCAVGSLRATEGDIVGERLLSEQGEAAEGAETIGGFGRRAVAALGLLGVMSFLTYLIAYFDFISPGFQVVVEEDPYLYLAMYLFIGLLLAVVASSKAATMFRNGVFLYTMGGVMLVTCLVFFGVMASVFLGGEFMYALPKLLRRIVKIAMAFVLFGFVYQFGTKTVSSFLLVLVMPLVVAKMTQMGIAYFAGDASWAIAGLYYYLSGIGFALIVCWTLFLVCYVGGGLLLSSDAVHGKRLNLEQEGREGCSDNAEDRLIARLGDRFNLTEREAEVLRYLAAGYTLKGISNALYVSPNTVKTHVAAVYRKLGLHSKQEVIDFVAAER